VTVCSRVNHRYVINHPGQPDHLSVGECNEYQQKLGSEWKHRGVWKPMKISDIGFLKTEPNRPKKFKNRKLGFCGSVFKKPTSAVWGRFFTLSHSQFILQHDKINSQSIFLHAVSLQF